MTDYRLLNGRAVRKPNGQIVLHIIVGKTDRVAEVPITRDEAIDLIASLAQAMRPTEEAR